MNTNIQIWSYLAPFCLEYEMFQTNVVEKIITHILCSITYFSNFSENRAVNGIMRNISEPDTQQMTIRLMCIACLIPKATNTHSEYIIRIAFSLQQWLHKEASVLRYTCFASFVLFSETSRAVLGPTQPLYSVDHISETISNLWSSPSWVDLY
jgi:hypothetical protein